MRKWLSASLAAVALSACSVGGAEDTVVRVASASQEEVVMLIHISLLNHPPETHALGYDKMQRSADAACQQNGRSAAQYTGDETQVSFGSSYDTWIQRSYHCT